MGVIKFSYECRYHEGTVNLAQLDKGDKDISFNSFEKQFVNPNGKLNLDAETIN